MEDLNKDHLMDMDMDELTNYLYNKYPEEAVKGNKIFKEQMTDAGLDPDKEDIDFILKVAEQTTEDLIRLAHKAIKRFNSDKQKSMIYFASICSFKRILKERDIIDSEVEKFFIKYPNTLRTVSNLIQKNKESHHKE